MKYNVKHHFHDDGGEFGTQPISYYEMGYFGVCQELRAVRCQISSHSAMLIIQFFL